MSQINSTRSGCKDVFKAFLVENAIYDGFLEIPVINHGIYKPKKLISFSKSISSTAYDSWVHFYEDDVTFERIWNNPKKYLSILQKYEGVICPDFSLYRDMPLVMQLWNIYRSRAIGNWLQSNGINVIANVRFGDSRTFKACCFGIPQNSTIAIGTHGCIKLLEDRSYTASGIEYVVEHLKPQRIVVYGTAPAYIFDNVKAKGIEILQFDSDYSISRKGDYHGSR